ncbi:histidinol-phosphate transaminase [Qingshengfaniella alkalisoli]|uniref:Histidinol-phosphate aminotransferase n=1 Tax=Qingshengfaniella alkalisoli TaxID=2599296 RepID=A0A5B8I5B1_9RHOB|nr:histidinol-phosphate transaminase [Qingshengfaniella alkalisoli]QDY68425.1 histidinol-phosphate transaminase [Qingshengfaniella alkalisoli]
MSQITPQPGIMDIALYEGGASKVEGVANVVKLSSNENPLGPSPKAIAAAQAAMARMNRYPSSDHAELRAAIAEVHGLDASRIICGAGSDEVLCFLCQGFAGPGDEVVYTEHGFGMYRIYALGSGATPVVAPERDRVVDVDAILAACTEKTRLVFIANPANPTGTMVDRADLVRLAEGIPGRAILVLDGAYAEFADGYDGGAALVEARDNVVMTRTFSKLYGLGGLRIGWGYGPKPVIDVLNRLRGPFNLSDVQLRAAEAAVRDRDYATSCQKENARLRNWLAAELGKLGVPSDQSYANFILARFADSDEVDACDAFLKSQGLIVRKVAGYGLSDCLRITVGDEDSCRRVVDAIRAFKEQSE